MGIVGLGGIGTRIASILRSGFSTRVGYYSRTRKEEEERRLGITYHPLEQLLEQVDVLILMTPSTPETTGMIGTSQISRIKNEILLINTARPEIILPQALLQGLESGKIGYAAFDGFYENINADLLKSIKTFVPQKLMITGHIASLTHEARDGMAKLATRSIVNLIKEGNDSYIVN